MKSEITYIFNFQKQLSTDSEFCKRLVSEKKGEGTIFYKRKLRSQKGLVGKCTLELKKYRCSLSHPEYEKFKAWSLINNIKVRRTINGNLEDLPLPLKQELYNRLFISKVRDYFKFEEIRLEIQKSLGNVVLSYSQDKTKQTINYADDHFVDGCPVTVRLIKLLGEDWQNANLKSDKNRKGHKSDMHQVFYSAIDLWNFCFGADSPSDIINFAKDRLGWDEKDKQTKKLVLLWSTISKHSQYGKLSLKALKNINAMLTKGFRYSDAVILAKIPEIVSVNDDQINELAKYYEDQLLPDINYQRKVRRITNKLIANYKSLNLEYRFAEHNANYSLQKSDREDIVKCIRDVIGNKEYNNLREEERNKTNNDVAELYQQFFYSTSRDFIKMPTIKEEWAEYLHEKFPNVPENKWSKLYHPSQINIFHQSNDERLGSPKLGAIKNPVALRTLKILRSKINALITEGLIHPDDTKIVVETAREMNNANMRWALKEWNKQREFENKEIEKLLPASKRQRKVNEMIEKVRFALEQSDFDKYDEKTELYKVKVGNYSKCKTQKCWCMYTNKEISLSNIFNGANFNIEHTLPLSQSLDNSDSNRTVCDAYYNQHIKGTLLPVALPNYEHDYTTKDGIKYTAIKTRLKKWEDRLRHLQDRVSYWRWRAKHAQTKDNKDFCIRQMHLWSIDAEYWRKKVETFKITEIKDGFRHSQLVDTRIITRYATLYLKSLFSNVDVQKGEVTSVFRKIFGLQDTEKAKDRSNNAHHAIDATMLILMPVPAKRERMLTLFYQREEKKKKGLSTQYEDNELKIEIAGLHIGKDVHTIGDYIKSNILVEHPKRRDALAPSTHYIRMKVKGKIRRKLYTEKSVIRGQLHEQTFLGAITQWKRNEDGTVVKDNNGKPVIDKTEIKYVSREPLKYKVNSKDPGFKSWKELADNIVNKDLVPMMMKQFKDGTSFEDACKIGIYMLDKKGNKVNKIRTVRVKRANNARIIKEQTYKSKIERRNYVYAKVGDMYAGCEYRDKTHRAFRIYNLMDIANRRQNHQSDIDEKIYEKGCILTLKRIFRPGDTVLVYDKSPDELIDLDNQELAKRLYIVYKGFESDRCRIKLVRNSTTIKGKIKWESIKDFKNLPSNIRTSMNRIHLLQEGIDFTLHNGKIDFKSGL